MRAITRTVAFAVGVAFTAVAIISLVTHLMDPAAWVFSILCVTAAVFSFRVAENHRAAREHVAESGRA